MKSKIRKDAEERRSVGLALLLDLGGGSGASFCRFKLAVYEGEGGDKRR